VAANDGKSLQLFCTSRINETMSNLFNRILMAHDRFFQLVSYLQSPWPLFIRVYWGWQLAESGWGKLHNLPRVADVFTSLDLPFPGQTALAFTHYCPRTNGQHAHGLRSGQVPCSGPFYVSGCFRNYPFFRTWQNRPGRDSLLAGFFSELSEASSMPVSEKQ
jgi:hypothetical protein